MFLDWFKPKEKCGLCDGKLREGAGIMQYRATDGDGIHHMFSMPICKECADDMDRNQIKHDAKEVREWLLRK